MRRFLLKVAICSPVLGAIATPVLFDGMLSKEYTLQDLDASTGPYLSVVKGTQNASHYTTLSHTQSTRLWNADDVAFAVSIDNSSVFTPGSSTPQFGFRRTDLIAQPSEAGANRTAFNNDVLETGTTAFHFSVLVDSSHPLNISHEYQLIYIEPNDGSHVFDLQTGTPFNTTVTTESHDLRIRSHNGTVLFHTPFLPDAWHNFAIVVDWTTLTLQTFYSVDGARLKEVSPVTANIGAVSGPNGKGDFHVALLKLPLIDPLDTPAEQADVVHFGIQEGTKESLIYSGVFVESIRDGLSGC